MRRMNDVAPSTPPPLLSPGDPPAFEVVNEAGKARILFVCDHASKVVPKRLGRLGIGEAELAQHIGWDIGAAKVTRWLAERFDAPAVLAGYSRLVIDCNRKFDDPTSIPEASDRVVIPANKSLSDDDRRARQEACFWPYHRAVAAALDRFQAQGRVPALLSMHSCTPVFDAQHRPWHIGILWHKDDRLAKPLLGALAADPAINVGDNEPYSGASPHAYTIPVHGIARGLPHVQFEIRQDLIGDDEGVERWARRLHRALAAVLADDALFAVRRY